MTAICYIGIELSARTQQFLLAMEFITLVVFAVVALIKVYAQPPAALDRPRRLSWFNPFDISSVSALNGGILLAVFIYWGWDSGGQRQRGDRGLEHGARASRRSSRRSSCVGDLPARRDRGAGLRRRRLARQQPGRRVRAARQGRARLGARQDPDHRGAELRVGVDADDDPADGANDAVDGSRRARSRSSSAESTRASCRPGFSTIWMGDDVDDRLRPAVGDEPRQPDRRRVHLAGADDRVLLRDHRLRLRHLSTGATCSTASRTSSCIGVLPFVGGLILTWVLVKAVIDYSQADGGYAKPFLGIGSPIAIALADDHPRAHRDDHPAHLTMPEFFKRKTGGRRSGDRSPPLRRGRRHEQRRHRRLRRLGLRQGGAARRRSRSARPTATR